ncbi:MAG: 30S ribosome-binding factor RbfA [Candidatus Latescibacteria bacterium]|nr:30S ribosome-binding factor RbfA [Candidatus Latescibacterota bacterium]
MPYRTEKVAEAIKSAVAEIIVEELADPKLGFVSITAIKLANDYKQATLYFSSFGENIEQEVVMNHLNHAAKFIKNRLKDKVVLRYIPELVFEIDRLLQEEQKIGKVLDDLKKSQANNETTDETDCSEIP